MEYIGIITHLGTIDPNFQRDIQEPTTSPPFNLRLTFCWSRKVSSGPKWKRHPTRKIALHQSKEKSRRIEKSYQRKWTDVSKLEVGPQCLLKPDAQSTPISSMIGKQLDDSKAWNMWNLDLFKVMFYFVPW